MSYSDDIRAQVAAGKSRDEIITAICKARKIPRDNARSAYNKAIKSSGAVAPAKQERRAQSREAAGLSEMEIRAKHDLIFQIRAGIKKLEDGKYPSEMQFVRDYCGITRGGYKQELERAEFADNFGRAGQVTYWGTRKSIAKLKADKVLI